MSENVVEIKITGTNTSDAAFKSATDAELKLGLAAKVATEELKREDAEISVVQRKLTELRVASAALGAQFKATGNEDVLKQFNKSVSDTKKLENFGKEFENLGKDADKAAKEAAKVGDALGKDVTKGAEDAAKGIAGLSLNMGAIPGTGQLIAIGVALAAIPALAAAGGAAIAAIGLGGIATGIAGAVMEAPQISIAFNHELDKVQQAWARGSASFIQPALDSVQVLGNALEHLPIEKTLQNLSKYTTGIATGIASFISEIGTGIANVTEKAGPILTQLGPDIAGLGTAIEHMLNKIGDGADGGAKALHQLFTVIDGVIGGAGEIINVFESAYGALDHFAHGVTDVVNAVGNVIPTFALLGSWLNVWDDRKPAAYGSVLKGTALDLENTAAAAKTAADAVQAASDAMDSAINKALGMENANVAVAQAFADMAGEVKKAGHSLDINTQSGRDNISMLTRDVGELERSRQANIANGMSVADANAKYSGQIAQLKAAAAAAGLNRSQVDALIGALDRIPSDIYSTIHISTVGGASMDKAAQQGRQNAHGGVLSGAASGGLRSGMTWVGEAGPEILDMSGLAGATIHTTGDSKRIAGGNGYGGNGNNNKFTLIVTAGDSSARTMALIADIRDYVNIQGGDGSILGIRYK